MIGFSALLGQGSVLGDLIHALGWTLLHSLWQGALAASLLWVLFGLLEKQGPRVRYGAAAVAMGLMMTAAIVTFVLLLMSSQAARVKHRGAPVLWFPAVNGGGSFAGTTQPWISRVGGMLDHAAPWLCLFWVAGVMVLVLRLGVGLHLVWRMKREETQPIVGEIQALFQDLCVRLRVTQAVKLLHSARVQVPMVIGWLRPAVLIPVGSLMGLSATQLEALLAHELAHIKRHDYLVSVLHSVMETLMFYHPAAWWISMQLRREREYCCDEVAVAVSGNGLEYARALSFLEEFRAMKVDMALGADGGELTMRIKRVLGYDEKPAISRMAALMVVATVFIAGAGWIATTARAQPSENTRVTTAPAPSPEKPAAVAAEAPVAPLAAKPVEAMKQQPQALPEVYQRWLDQDVLWIIQPQEKTAFLQLTSDEERDHFIEQFWARRDADARGEAASFKEQHYARIAYANQHFGGSVPGWKSDRGHIFIVYGRPQSIDSHPHSVGATAPFEVWHYGASSAVGHDADFKFVDECQCGQYSYLGSLPQ